MLIRAREKGLEGRRAMLSAAISSLIFNNPLNSSLNPTKAVDGTYTFARTSTATVEAFGGPSSSLLVKDVLAEEVRFKGARRVENLRNEDFSDWVLSSTGTGSAPVLTSGFTDPDGGSTAYRLQGELNGGTTVNDKSSLFFGGSDGAGDKILSVWLKSNTGSTQYCHLRTGNSQGNDPSLGAVTVTTTWQRFAIINSPGGAGDDYLGLRGDRSNGQDSLDILIWHPLKELTDGQANQNPSEYVSAGVGTGPELATTNADFSTDDTSTNGTVGEWTWTGGNWEISSGAARANGGFASMVGEEAIGVVGRLYAVSYDLTNDLVAAVFAGIGLNKIAGQRNVTVVRASSATGISFSSDAGADAIIDNVSIKEIDHGTNVDGVKYFPYENGNTVSGTHIVTEAQGSAIAAATLEGVYREGARTNIAEYSEQFDNAWWNKGGTTVGTDAIVAPDGHTTAESITSTNILYSSVNRTVTVANATAYTLSVYAKEFSTSLLSMEFRGAGLTPDAEFNLSSGTIVTDLEGTAFIESVGNGWYRCGFTKTSVDTSELIIIGQGNPSAVGDSIYIWGAQLEVGSFVSSYIPTAASGAVTRTVETLSYPGANMDGTIGALTATINIPGNSTGVLHNTVVSVGNPASNSNPMYVDAGTGTLRSFDGTNQISGSAVSVNTSHNVGVAWGGSTFETYLDGSQDGTDTFDGDFQVDTLSVGNTITPNNYLFGTIKDLQIYKKHLNQAKMEQLT